MFTFIRFGAFDFMIGRSVLDVAFRDQTFGFGCCVSQLDVRLWTLCFAIRRLVLDIQFRMCDFGRLISELSILFNFVSFPNI